MPLLIDTFNVLHVTGVLPPDLAGLDVAGLASLIAISRYADDRVTLVCDGTPAKPRRPSHGPGTGVAPHLGQNLGHAQKDDLGRRNASGRRSSRDSGTHSDAGATSRFGPVVVRFSGHAMEADDLIGRMIDRSTAPRSLLVVSSDRRVRAMAARRRCAWLPSDRFLDQLVEDHRNGHRRSPSRGLRSPGGPAVPLAPAEILRWGLELGLDAEDLDRPVTELLGEPRSPGEPPPPRPTPTPDSPSKAPPPKPNRPAPPAQPPQSAPRASGGSTGSSTGRSTPRSAGRYRPLDEAERLEEIDPSELERFDLEQWLRDHHREGPPR